MLTTRSENRRNNQQESTESLSEGLVLQRLLENVCHLDQDASIAGPPSAKSPRTENSLLENLGASLKNEITRRISERNVEAVET